MTQTGTFNGLAEMYDSARPRYPVEVFRNALSGLPADRPWYVVDAGAGTGIALETLVPLLPDGSQVWACDVSTDMVAIGQRKFPTVTWLVEPAETFLEPCQGLSLIVAAQSYQWMDRPRFLAASRAALQTPGVLMIIQNNRDHQAGGLAGDYEDLLEEYSPGYSRWYRTIDIAHELSGHFDKVAQYATSWVKEMSINEFVTMSQSSTQAQRAVSAHGDAFFHRVRTLAADYATDQIVQVPYVTEAFVGLTT